MQLTESWPQRFLSKVVGEEKLASALLHDVNIGRADELLNSTQVFRLCEQVVAVNATPELLKLHIVDEHLSRAGRIRTVFQVIFPTVPKQRASFRVKEHR